MNQNASPEAADASPGQPKVQLEPSEVIALGCLLLGWFVMNTLVTDLGAVQQTFRFYNVWTMLRDPARLATGMTGGDRAVSLGFAVICLATATAILVPFRLRTPKSWLAYFAPLALMVVCAAVLWSESATNAFSDGGRYGSTGSHIIQFANSLVNRASASFAKRISLGFGAYLSFAASLFLAWRGLVRLRQEESTLPQPAP